MMFLILLAACLPVDGAEIRGRDLVGSGALTGVPDNAFVAYSPAPSVPRIFTLEDLRRIAGRYELPEPQPREVCFERRTAPLDARALETAMRAALKRPDASLTLVDISRYPSPAGEIVFRKQDLHAPASHQANAPVLWRGYVQYEPAKRFPIWARVRVTVPVTHSVAASDIAIGTILEPSHLRSETRQEFPGVNRMADGSVLVGTRARRAIPAGKVLDPQWFEAEPDVRKGETVEVRVTGGSARLVLSATAQGNGRSGQWVALRNPQSGKLFRGLVQSRGVVVVEK
jgi:flagella basal body P-ring formation protein FlgA